MSQQQDKNRVVLGGFVILLGVLLLLDRFFVFNVQRVVQFWPMVFLLGGGLKMSQSQSRAGYLFGLGLVVIGALMTLSNLGWISFSLRDWWPLLLIGAGAAMVTSGTRKSGAAGLLESNEASAPDNDRLRAMAVLGGAKIKVTSQDFRAGEATAVMGGLHLDFRQASIQSQAMLKVFAMWGGIEIKVPPDWTVVCNGTPILGGMEDKSIPPMQASKRLVIEGVVLMGGVEIKN